MRMHVVLCGLVLATTSVDAFVISEIHYRPPPGEANLEFVEIFNDSVTPQDLSGYRFVEGIEFEFPPATILPGGGSLVVCADAAAVKAAYGIENAIGDFVGSLSDNGERITIVNHVALPALSVAYRDRGKWPSAPDGTGHTLSLTSIYRDPAEPENWTASVELGGTPGLPNFPPGEEPAFELITFLDVGAEWRYKKGTEPYSEPQDAWTQPEFDDGEWPVGPSGFGFGDEGHGTVLDDMRGNYSSLAIRGTLTLQEEDLAGEGDFLFGMRYDDGFCAYVNGSVAARSNCPPVEAWDGLATASRELRDEVFFQIERALLKAGPNSIAIIGYNRSRSGSDFGIVPRVVRRDFIGNKTKEQFRGCFNELYRGGDGEGAWVELYNPSSVTVSLEGLRVTNDAASAEEYTFPPGTIIEAHGFLVLPEQPMLNLSTPVVSLFLRDPDGLVIAAQVFDRIPADGPLSEGLSEARFPDGGRPGWLTATRTPGASNDVPRTTDIVINEIFYHPPRDRAGEFIELYNRGTSAVDLSGFRFTKGISYTFPPETLLAAGNYLVIAEDPEIIRHHYDDEAGRDVHALGPYAGQLANGGENVRLVDTLGNLVDEVRYADGGPWSEWPDGRGASLELIDPSQDNDIAAAWAPSDDSDKAEWEQLSYTVETYAPAGESELHLFLAERGICHVDDISIATGAFAETDIVPAGSVWKFRRGTGPFSDPPMAWTEADFDDSTWETGQAGFGYGDDDDATILDDMRGSYTSVVVRKRFEVPQELLDLEGGIFLGVNFDDGFCAFLNGVEVASGNCPLTIAYDSRSRGSREANEEEFFELPPEAFDGTSLVLAIIGFNSTPGSNDFSLHPRVVHRRPSGTGPNHLPNPGFEENTSGWRIEGTHGTSRRITHDSHTGEACLQLIATGKGDNLCNRIETDTIPRMEAREYQVSMWARWQRGTDLIIAHGEFAPGSWPGTRDVNLSNNSLGGRMRMTIPWNLGSPGRENSVRANLRAETGDTNLGPVIEAVRHAPLTPDVGDPVIITARVLDSDGIASVIVHYSRTSGDFQTAEMFDDGEHGDGAAGDGVYAARLQGFGLRDIVRFFVEATDRRGAAQRFPLTAPTPSCLFMVDTRVTEQIRIVMETRNRQRLDTRPLHSNELVDATFIFDDDDVYYNVGIRYRGSPWGRPSKQSYRVRFNKDQRYHRGRKDVNIANRDRNDGIGYFLIGRNGRPGSPAPVADYQYVRTRLNSQSLGAPGVFETVDRDFLERWYGAEAAERAVCLKGNGRLRFNDACQRTGWDEATLAYREEWSENYRFYWAHSVHQSRENWRPMYALTRVLDPRRTENDDFDVRVHDVLDVEAFLRVLAPRILMMDGDALFVGNGHNGYMVWDPTDELWETLPFDMGPGIRGTSPNLLGVRDVQVRRILTRAVTARTYYRIISEYIDGYWSATRAGPYLDALQRSPARLGAGAKNQLLGSESNVRRQIGRYTDVEFRLTINDGEDLVTEDAAVTLTGQASVHVVDIAIQVNDGPTQRLDVAWTEGPVPIRWEAALELVAGANRVQISGLDWDSQLIGTDTMTITRTALNQPFVRGDANQDAIVNMSDPIAVLLHLFAGRVLRCADAADANDNGGVDMDDVFLVLRYLFDSGAPPPAPFPEAGNDQGDDALDCRG